MGARDERRGRAGDERFARAADDLPAFCKANGYECLEVGKEKGIVTVRIRKPETCPVASGEAPANHSNDATLVVRKV